MDLLRSVNVIPGIEYSDSSSAGLCSLQEQVNHKTSFKQACTMYRPHGVLARTLYNKCLADERLERIDRNKWYVCKLDAFPASVADLFLPLEEDDATSAFLESCALKSEWILTQLWHNLARSLLGWFLCQTSINGLLGRGSMFVFSREQFLRLVGGGGGGGGGEWRRGALLDVGAGDGATTAVIAPLFDAVYVTEVSAPMRWVLQRKGFQLLDADSWEESGIRFDVITCLNLLDRCDQPVKLLRALKSALTPDGILVVALVLPFQPYVETGRLDHQPTELLPVQGRTFEEQIYSVIKDVFLPLGFAVKHWSRLPYLCEGDLNQAFYWLDDAVFVLKPSVSSSLQKLENSEVSSTVGRNRYCKTSWKDGRKEGTTL